MLYNTVPHRTSLRILRRLTLAASQAWLASFTIACHHRSTDTTRCNSAQLRTNEV